MQDRLLEEAKKKISCLPEAAPLVPNQPMAGASAIGASTSQNENEMKNNENKVISNQAVSEADRITISQRTGYIQVKTRPSTDQEDQRSSTPVSVAPVQVGSIGPQRRLSNQMLLGSSTPPRKILPKEPESTNVAPPATGNGNPNQHLPIGVVGAALSSSRPPMTVTPMMVKAEGQGNPVGQVINGSNSTPPPPVPLSQPLLINTSMTTSGGHGHHQPAHPQTAMVTQIQPGQAVPQGSIISAIRMPTIIRQPGHTGVPIIMNQMPQIALPNGSILQPVTVTSAPSNMIRAPFVTALAPPGHIMTLPTGQAPVNTSQGQYTTSGAQSLQKPQVPTTLTGTTTMIPTSVSVPTSYMMQQTPSGVATSVNTSLGQYVPASMTPAISSMQVANTTTKCNTDVTVANAQPMVSPGPPLLSPQFQQHLANNAPPPQTPTTSSYAGATGVSTSNSANTTVTTSTPTSVLRSLRPPLPTRGPPVGGLSPLTSAPPLLTPSGLPVTSGAVIRSVLPNIRGKTQFSRMPSASGGTCQVSGSPNLRATVPNQGALTGAVGSNTSQANVTKPNSKPFYTSKPPSVSSAAPTINPVNTTSNPAKPRDNPVYHKDNPVNSRDNPVKSKDSPVNPNDNPVNPRNNPVNPRDNPVNSRDNPVNPRDNPVNPRDNPVNSRINPGNTVGNNPKSSTFTSTSNPKSQSNSTSSSSSKFEKSLTQSEASRSAGNKSFRVDDESSPYAFEAEPEPLEIRPSVPPYRRKQPDMTKQILEPQKRENKPSVPEISKPSASAMTQTSSNTTKIETTDISSKKSKLQGMSSQRVQLGIFTPFIYCTGC